MGGFPTPTTEHVFHRMSVFKDRIRQQLLDGITRWSAPVQTKEGLDTFEIEVVEPLLELEAEGLVTLGEPHRTGYRFGVRIDVMTVVEVHLD